MTHPFTPTYIDKQIARAAAILPAAGAWDAAPVELFVGGASKVTLFFSYTTNAAGGAFDFAVFVADMNPAARWYQTGLYDAGAMVAGTDIGSAIQREYITYTATGADPERFVHGAIELGGAVEWLRIPCRESGNVGKPGNLRIDISLSWE